MNFRYVQMSYEVRSRSTNCGLCGIAWQTREKEAETFVIGVSDEIIHPRLFRVSSASLTNYSRSVASISYRSQMLHRLRESMQMKWRAPSVE